MKINTNPKPSLASAVSVFVQDGDALTRVSAIPRSAAGPLIQKIRALGERRPHKNCKPVEIVSFNPAKVADHPEIDATCLQVGYVFESAWAASLYFGFKHNEVAQRLSKARGVARLMNPGELDVAPTATVRGVTLRYSTPRESLIQNLEPTNENR
jgi:hypothetical protein